MTAPLPVLVVGAAGLAGGELLRLLLTHPGVSRVSALSQSHAGRPAHEQHRALLHLPPVVFADTPVADAAREAAVVFLAVPHGRSQTVMAELGDDFPGVVVDLAADFRVHDRATYEAEYGAHACFERVAQFVYGLPELDRDAIRDARRIANPGCFATSAELLLLPLAAAGLLPEIVPVFAVTGSSGAGAQPKLTTHHPFRAGNMFAYKILAHQHEGEIAQTLSAAAGAPHRVRLLPHSGPFVRGIHATAWLTDAAYATRDLAALYADFYASHPFVHVLDRPPQVAEVAATNHVHVHVHQAGAEVALTLCLDNLVKGAAGQAVQNMNLAVGWNETDGLTAAGVFPC